MKVIIDRFEDTYAVCEKEDRTMINIKIADIPKEAKEGDVLILSNTKIYIDVQKTAKRKDEIEEITKDLWV